MCPLSLQRKDQSMPLRKQPSKPARKLVGDNVADEHVQAAPQPGIPPGLQPMPQKPGKGQHDVMVYIDPMRVPLPALKPERELVEHLQLPATVTTQEEYENLTTTLVMVRKARKAFEAKESELLKPLKESFKAAIETLQRDLGLAPFIDKAKVAEKRLEILIVEWHHNERERQEREEKQAAADRRAEQARVRAAGGNPLTVQAAPVQAAPPPTTRTMAGTMTMMKVAKWRMVDPALVPYEYNGIVLWQLNEVEITKLRKEMGTGEGVVSPIPGIEFYVDETPSIR